jgi:hypothetical protein
MLLSSWVVALIAITALGFVLHPMTNPFKNIALGNFTPSGTYFLSNLSSAPQNTVTTLADRAINTDWVSELMYENMKLSSAQIHLFGRAKAELGEGQECVGTGISRSAAGSVKSIVGYNLTTNPAGARDSPAVFLRQAMSAGKTYGQTAAA